MHTLRHKTSRFKNNHLFVAEYSLAVEEPLEIHIDGAPYAVTMRLPGDDINLVTGYCFSEGIIGSWDDIASIGYADEVPGNRRVSVRLNSERGNRKASRRELTALLCTSSSGLGGRSSDGRIHSPMEPVKTVHSIHPQEILQLKHLFESKQTTFPLTGSTHAAAIFDVKKGLLAFAEDTGRHNAFDKAIGSLVRLNKTREAFLGMLSSRLSYEMVQKAGKLGLEILSGFSAPTSMAVQMTQDLNITLIGLLRENSMNIYTHPGRIVPPPYVSIGHFDVHPTRALCAK